MKFFSSIIVFLISITLFSQGEANIWYFGENAGLNFNNCDPFAITDGELNTIEGCSSFSDANGNLLFYSDGSFVWNNEHNLMPNGVGLLGNSSSSQSAMIIPKPGSTNIYYLFTVGDMSNPGFNYYIIDMDEDDGMGDVIEGPIELSENRIDWTEKVAAVKGAESGTYWVLSYVPNEFRAYKVTTQGVINSPVQSPSFPANDAKGYLKISPDGKKVAIAHEGDSAFLLYDFNDITGKVTNEILLPLITEGKNPYGVEFSANSKKLYVHATDYVDIPSDEENPEEPEYNATLFQFDISSDNESTIINSRTIIHIGNLYRGGLQLGPDKKIYRTLSRSYVEGIPLLGVIENPENSGTACNYNHASVGLLGNLGRQGLPPFIASIFSQIQLIGESEDGTRQVVNGQTVYLCDGESFEIFSESIEGRSMYEWFYNGSTTPFSTESVLRFNNANTSLNGDYRLEVTNISPCGNISTLIGEFTIEVYDPLALPPFIQFDNCDVDGTADGFTDFNLDEISTHITNDNPDLTVTYYLSFLEADNDINSLTPVPFNNSIATRIYARIENPTGCHSVTTVDLEVSTTDFPFGYTGEQLGTCDDDDNIDGLHLFDLAPSIPNILSQFPPQPLSVHFYNSLSDAQLELNEIDISSEYMSTVPFLEIIYVRVENDDDGSCYGIGPYLTLRVDPRPEFEVVPEIIFCRNLVSFVTLETFNPNGNYSYEWKKKENNSVLSSNPVTTVSQGGIYTVIATSTDGYSCQSFEKEINVIESDVASIDLDDVSITDDAINNIISINNTGNNLGVGDYEFALNYAFGEYQDSPIFENVPIGIHVIYVKDKNGCGVASLEVSVIGFPKFFTPNNDGQNDIWRVKGINRNFYTESIVEIYDRFGKILAIIEPFTEGWDGIYNGEYLPESDYWFKANIINNDGSIRKRQGHFSLIRKIEP